MALTGLTNLQPLHIKTVGIGTFDNAVSIGGTLTYEDVTNVDAIGIITARSGVNVSGGQLDVGSNIKIGNAGVITATAFVGDGSGLTGAGPSLTGSTNNTIVTVTGANAIQGEANLTFDGDTLLLKSSTDGRRVSFAGDGTSHYMKYDNTLGGIILNGYGGITFETNGTNERLRITSGGKFGFGTNSPYTYGIATFNDVNGIVLEGSSQGRLLFRHTGGGTNLKMFDIQSSDGVMKFRTIADNGTTVTERLRITSAGNVLIGTDTGSEKLCIKRDDTVGPTITLENNANKTYINNWGSTGGGGSGSGRTNRFEINATLASQASYCAPFHTFMTGGTENNYEKVRITSDGRLLINSTAVTNSDDFLTIKRPAGNHAITTLTLDSTTATGSYANALIFTKSKDYYYNGLIFTSSTGHQGGICARMTTVGGSTPEIQMRIGGSSFASSDTLAMSIKNTGTVQSYYHATSKNGIVQTQQVTSETRYSGSPSSVDLITGSTFTPKTSAPRFLIMIFCPVNTSDDSDAGGGNTNFYFYGRIEYRKNGGGWIECDNQGSTSNQGGYAAHVELSPNRTGPNTTDYWSGNRYRTESKTATILVTNVGDCGSSGNVQFKLRCYSYSGNFIQIGQPHGNGTDDNYGVQPWGFTVFELAPDSNSYTAY